MLRLLKSLPLALPIMSLLALAAMGFVLTSCTSGSQAQARFVHAIWDAGELDIDFNGNKDFPELSFLGHLPSTGYTAVPAGSDTVEGFQANSNTEAFVTPNVSLTAGTQYTLVATGNIASGTSSVPIMAPPDNNTEPNVGTVSFRVINASPDGPGQGVYIYIQLNPVIGNGCTLSTGPTVSALTYQQTSSYVNLNFNANGGYTLFVCNAVNGNPLFSQNLGSIGSSTEGSIRTLILTDNSSGSTLNLSAIVLDDLN
jgi:hypothetical protein